MNDWLEPDFPEPPKPFREQLLAKIKEKQSKHLTSIGQALSPIQSKWDDIYRFETNLIASKSAFEVKSRNVTDVDVIELFRDVPKSIKIHQWEQMENLNISYQWCHLIGKESLNSIGLGIKNMPNLKRLNLNFWKCYGLEDKDFRNLSQHIFHQLLNLQQLTINFELCSNISDHALKIFSEALSKNVLSLQSLTLILIKCELISDKGTIELLTGLDRYSVNLQKLSLNLSGCYKVTNRTLQFFNNGSKCHRLGNLKQLILNFAWTQQLTDEGLEDFAEGICRYCPQLNLLNLNFSACSAISDKGFLAVGSKTAQSLKKLEKIFLNFGSCFKITSEALEKVADDIKTHLPNLKQLKLSLIGCSKIDSTKKKAIKVSLSYIPKLELI